MREMLEMNSNQGLDDLIGARVEIWSNSGDDNHADQGVLVAVELPWIRIQKEKGQLLIFPIYNVRLIKVMDRQHPNALSRTLLRPSAPQQIEAGKKE